MNKIKKYFLALLLLELFFTYAPVYAQTTPQTPTAQYGDSTGTCQPDGSGVCSQIAKYLCTPNSPNVGNNPNGVLFSCINQLYKFAIVVAAVVGVFYIVIAGYIYMSADGSQESTDKAKDILVSTLTALVILFAGYVILAAINPDLVKFNPIQTPNVTLSAPTGPAATTQPTATNVNTSCTQNFSGVSASAGCSGATTSSNGTCIDVFSKTSHNDPSDCSTDNGICLMSSQAAQRIQTFITTFNSIAQGACEVQIASAIQIINPPSISSCHNPAASNAGTCADMHVIPYNATCQQDFYQAAQQSGVVTNFQDEYCSAVPSTTGGNIHVNF